MSQLLGYSQYLLDQRKLADKKAAAADKLRVGPGGTNLGYVQAMKTLNAGQPRAPGADGNEAREARRNAMYAENVRQLQQQAQIQQARQDAINSKYIDADIQAKRDAQLAGYDQAAQERKYAAANEHAELLHNFENERDWRQAGYASERQYMDAVYQAMHAEHQSNLQGIRDERMNAFHADQAELDRQQQLDMQYGHIVGQAMLAVQSHRQNLDRDQAHYQLQAQLSQTQLNQQEEARMRRLQGAAEHVRREVTGGNLSEAEGNSLITQIMTGLDPLQQRMQASQILTEEYRRSQMDTQTQNIAAHTAAMRDTMGRVDPNTGEVQGHFMMINGRRVPVSFNNQTGQITRLDNTEHEETDLQKAQREALEIQNYGQPKRVIEQGVRDRLANTRTIPNAQNIASMIGNAGAGMITPPPQLEAPEADVQRELNTELGNRARTRGQEAQKATREAQDAQAAARRLDHRMDLTNNSLTEARRAVEREAAHWNDEIRSQSPERPAWSKTPQGIEGEIARRHGVHMNDLRREFPELWPEPAAPPVPVPDPARGQINRANYADTPEGYTQYRNAMRPQRTQFAVGPHGDRPYAAALAEWEQIPPTEGQRQPEAPNEAAVNALRPMLRDASAYYDRDPGDLDRIMAGTGVHRVGQMRDILANVINSNRPISAEDRDRYNALHQTAVDSNYLRSQAGQRPFVPPALLESLRLPGAQMRFSGNAARMQELREAIEERRPERGFGSSLVGGWSAPERALNTIDMLLRTAHERNRGLTTHERAMFNEAKKILEANRSNGYGRVHDALTLPD